MTAGTTATTPPPKSPAKMTEIGPALLPRVRPQDQSMDFMPPTHGFAHSRFNHGRTASVPVNAFQHQFGSYLPQSASRRSVSPPGRSDLATPGSAPLAFDHMVMDTASRRPSMHARTVSTSNIRSHSRNSSSTSIDASVLGRYGFPTYRHSPGPQPGPTNTGAPMSRTPSAMSHLAPIAMPNGHIQSYPIRRRTASPPANPSRLSVEADVDACDWQGSTSTILEYLTASNPKPSLTQRKSDVNHLLQPFMWFDVRNVSAWTDFNMTTLSAIPGLLDLLNVGVAAAHLPTPGRVNVYPETSTQLAEMCASFHAVKVNAALKVAQGDKHMVMRALQQSGPGSRPQPEFVSNYQSDLERTIYGDGRGRVVGIVKCYDQWNSGMRNGTAPDKVNYLRGLARLHHFMREHGCRYGFIITEIELVCVRAGVAKDSDSTLPLFGCLEVAQAIQIATSGKDSNGNLQMTVGLALWYLHMLAKEQPMPGHFHWKLEVGGPAAMTRKHHLPRDDWMPKPNIPETRAIKKIRGWLWPAEPLNRKECGRGKRKS